MKKISLSVIACSFLMMSCNSDDLNNIENTSVNFELKTGTIPVQNSANEKDYSGKIFNDLKSTLNSNITALVLEDIIREVEIVASENNDFTAISKDYEGIDSIKVNEVLASTDTFSLIESTNFTSVTKDLLFSFTAQLENMDNLAYNDIYNYIIGFENEIINNGTINKNEKDRVLAITSITRYSYHIMNEEADPIRFGKIKTNLHGAISGADSDIATAITMTLVMQAATSNQ